MTAAAATTSSGNRQSGFNPGMHAAVEIIHFGKSFLLQQFNCLCTANSVIADNNDCSIQWQLRAKFIQLIQRIQKQLRAID